MRSYGKELLEFFREIDAAANSSYGAGGFVGVIDRTSSDKGGAWSNLMYAYTKCVFLMLSGKFLSNYLLFMDRFCGDVSAAMCYGLYKSNVWRTRECRGVVIERIKHFWLLLVVRIRRKYSECE